jgi:(R,R)-butanediol dehydrogenase/meso-butanediol dehydrogenase/diacetyl reductase
MRVLNIHGPGDARLDTVAPPEVGPNDVLMRVGACGICGSDLGYIRRGGVGRRMASDEAPVPLGHEAAGVVIEAGSAVKGIKPGMRVALNPMTPSGAIGSGASEGAFTEGLLVRGAQAGVTLYPMPDGMDFEVAALVEPLSVSLHGIHRGQVQPGDKAVVFGAGPIGLGMVLWLRIIGVTDVVSVDLSPRRLERARSLGATATIVAGDGSLRKGLAELHGRTHTQLGDLVGTDVYFDAAGARTIVPSVISMAKPDARLVITAVYSQPVEIDLAHFLTREMHITSAMGSPTEFPEVIDMLAQHGDVARKMISNRLGFDDIISALDVARSLESGKVMITFPLD